MLDKGNIDKYMGPRGYVIVELCDKRGRVKAIHKYNTVTNLGKLLYLYDSANKRYMGPSGNSHGQLFCNSGLGKFKGSSSYGVEYNAYDAGEAVFLINKADAIDANSNILPIYNSDYTLNVDSVVGYASYKTETPNIKEGVMTTIKGTSWASQMAVVRRYKFDFDKANGGPFNKICIGHNILSNRFKGAAIAKGIDMSVLPNDSLGYYLRPGLSGVTDNNQILTGLGSNLAKYKFDLLTGDMTTIETTDRLYNMILGDGKKPQYYSDGYVYWLDTSASRLYKKSLVDLSQTYYYSSSIGDYNTLFMHGGYLYVKTSSTQFIAVNPLTMAASSANNLLTTAMNLPVEFTGTINIANYGDNYIVADSTNGYAVECTDILNVNGSIVNILPGITNTTAYNVNNHKTMLMTNIGDDIGVRRINNASGYSGENSLKVCDVDAGYCGNMTHFIELTSPINKTSQDIMYITFGIEFSSAQQQ